MDMKKPLVTYKQEMAPGEYATVIVGNTRDTDVPYVRLTMDMLYRLEDRKYLRQLARWLSDAADSMEGGT